MFRRYRLGSGERGQALVELALVLLLLLLLLAGAVDLGRAFNNYIIVTNASREGARYASHFPIHLRGILDATEQEAANSGITLTDSQIRVPTLGATAGNPIRVEITFPFSTILSDIVHVQTITLTASTEMVVFGTRQPTPQP